MGVYKLKNEPELPVFIKVETTKSYGKVNDRLVAETELKTGINRMLILFISLLVLSGVTAFPLESELWMLNQFSFFPAGLKTWITTVYIGLRETNYHYPFMAYGTDWLAFAHIAIAVFFIGPLKDPIRNIWVIEAGLIVSVLIFPLAFIAGSVRGIPFFWQLIDCAFGVVSFGLLWLCRRSVLKLEALQMPQH